MEALFPLRTAPSPAMTLSPLRLLALTFLISCFVPAANAEKKPNFLLIVGDDGAAVAEAAEVLRREERVTPDGSERARVTFVPIAAAVSRAERLRGIFDERKAIFPGKVQRALSSQHDMRRFLHDAAGNADGVDDVNDRSDCTSFPARAMHDGCVKLDETRGIGS